MKNFLSKEVLKIVCILGLVLGIIASVPVPTLILYIGLFMFFFFSPSIMLYARKKKMFEVDDYKQSALIGGILGAIGTVSFLCSFALLCFVFSFVPNNYFMLAIRPLLNLEALWLVVIIVIMVAVVNGAANAVSAMLLQFVLNSNIKSDFKNVMKREEKNGRL